MKALSDDSEKARRMGGVSNMKLSDDALKWAGEKHQQGYTWDQIAKALRAKESALKAAAEAIQVAAMAQKFLDFVEAQNEK